MRCQIASPRTSHMAARMLVSEVHVTQVTCCYFLRRVGRYGEGTLDCFRSEANVNKGVNARDDTEDPHS